MVFVCVCGRATPDRTGERVPINGVDLIPYVDAHGRAAGPDFCGLEQNSGANANRSTHPGHGLFRRFARSGCSLCQDTVYKASARFEFHTPLSH